MHYSGGMCSQYINVLDPGITMEESVANNIFGTMHFNGGMYSQYINLLDPSIPVEESVANILIIWTHALQWRNV